MSAETAIEFSGVGSGYRGKPVLRNVSFTARPGELLGLLGPNGAGKTTLLRTITGRCRPLSGTVRVFGRDLASLSSAERARCIAVVPQELETPAAYTVGDIVMVGRTAALNRWRGPCARDRHVVERAMAYTDVIDMQHRPFAELSGGEKQRTIVALALAQEPRIILMDEATSQLDINHRLEVMQIVERLTGEQRVTVIMISHDLNLAAEFCGRILLLDRGAVAALGTPPDVLREPVLREVYRCDVRVQQDPARGTVSVHPAPRLAAGRSGRGIRVHLVCGGGCGEETMRHLALCDYTVTAGVLNAGDSDALAAEALGLHAALEKPFSPVSAARLEEARAMADAADAVVVCAVPFGPGNLVNMDLAVHARGKGKPVFIAAGTAQRDYTPGHRAAAQAAELEARGARSYTHLAALFAGLPAAADTEGA